jgi:hypothetical protein
MSDLSILVTGSCGLIGSEVSIFTIPLKELPTRSEYADPAYAERIPESFSIDQSRHSIFGASKVAADVMAGKGGCGLSGSSRQKEY